MSRELGRIKRLETTRAKPANFRAFTQEPRVFMMKILLGLSVSVSRYAASLCNTPRPIAHASLNPNLEQSKTLPVKFGWRFIREGDSIAHAAPIMPQIGKPRPKRHTITVSYQITRVQLVRNSGEEPFVIKDKQILGVSTNPSLPGLLCTVPQAGLHPHGDRLAGREQR